MGSLLAILYDHMFMYICICPFVHSPIVFHVFMVL